MGHFFFYNSSFKESCGGRGTVKVSTSNLVIGKATRCNLLEDNQTPLKVAGGSFDVAFGPFEIITVRLSVA
jgi:alpha-mannosidase